MLQFFGYWTPSPARMPLLGLALRSSIATQINKTVADVGENMRREISENLQGRVLNVRSGKLYGSVRLTFKNYVAGSAATISVGQTRSVPYEKVHEYGMDIHAKGNKPMRFKLVDANRLTGVSPLRGGGPIQPEPTDQWISAWSVRIPARPYFWPVVEDAKRSFYPLLSVAVQRGIDAFRAMP